MLGQIISGLVFIGLIILFMSWIGSILERKGRPISPNDVPKPKKPVVTSDLVRRINKEIYYRKRNEQEGYTFALIFTKELPESEKSQLKTIYKNAGWSDVEILPTEHGYLVKLYF